jgi:aminoglycoside 6'-N-acetyltransferase
MPDAILRGPRVSLRPVRPDDRDALHAILAEPSVARWWAQSGVDAAIEDIYGTWEHEAFAIEVGGRLVGYLQVAEETDPDYRHASIDLFIATAAQGRGYGPEAIRVVVDRLFRERGHHRVTIDPAVANEPAIAAYRKVGFQPVGVMRRYERGPDGDWHDALLMDLLTDDLRA